MLVNAKIVLSISRCSSRSIWVDVSLVFMVDLLVRDLFSGGCCCDFEKNHCPDDRGRESPSYREASLWSLAVSSVAAIALALSFAGRDEQQIENFKIVCDGIGDRGSSWNVRCSQRPPPQRVAMRSASLSICAGPSCAIFARRQAGRKRRCFPRSQHPIDLFNSLVTAMHI
jgi:hypothetical protein